MVIILIFAAYLIFSAFIAMLFVSSYDMFSFSFRYRKRSGIVTIKIITAALLWPITFSLVMIRTKVTKKILFWVFEK